MLMHQLTKLGALAISLCLLAVPAVAQVVITQAKAIAGGVTPGDAAGFPVTLSRKGSYRLQSNLNPPAGKDGIQIKSHDLTIDFNGFVMDGVQLARTGIRGNGAAAERLQHRDDQERHYHRLQRVWNMGVRLLDRRRHAHFDQRLRRDLAERRGPRSREHNCLQRRSRSLLWHRLPHREQCR